MPGMRSALLLFLAVPAAADTLIVLNKAAHTATFLDGNGTALATLKTGAGPHEGAVSPDGTRAVVCNYGVQRRPGNTLTVYALPEPKVEKTIDLGAYTRPHGIVFMPDGKRVVVTAEGKQALIVVDLETGKVETAVDTGQLVSHMVAVHGDRAYVANIFSGSMTAVDLKEKKRLKIVPTGRGAEGIDVAPDGKEVWVTNRAANTISVVDAETLAVVATIPCADFPIRAKFTPDGARVLVSCAKTGDVVVLDAKKRAEVARIDLADPARKEKGTMFGRVRGPLPIGILIPPGGARAFVACGNYDQVAVLDLAKNEVVARHATGREPDGLAYSAR